MSAAPPPIAIPCLLFLTFAFVPIAIVVLPTADAFEPTATLAVLNAAPLLVEYAPLPIAILSLLSAFAPVPITTTLFLLAVASLPKPTAFKPVTLAPEPNATAVALLPLGTSFVANATLALDIANAANTAATTTFFLPLLFLANSDTTT